MSESKHPLSDEVLNGNEMAWTNWGIKCYDTNFGQVELNEDTEELVSCCIGLGRNQGNTAMSIKIIGGEFQITCDSFGSIWAELCSPKYPYKDYNPTKKSIEVNEVLQMLQKDNNYSIAAIIVKKKLIRLMKYQLHFTAVDKSELKELFRIWRKPVLKRDLVTRKPIIKRTPIIITSSCHEEESA